MSDIYLCKEDTEKAKAVLKEGYKITKNDRLSKREEEITELNFPIELKFERKDHSLYSNDYNLILSKTIYETEGVPSAYKFDFEDEKDTYHGYIVIGAQEEYAPVIEYSFSDEKGFLDSAEANEEIYYVGGYDYFAVNEGTGTVKNLNTQEEVQSVSIDTYNNSTDTSDYSDMWKAIYKAYEKKAVVPVFIKDPSPMEDGYMLTHSIFRIFCYTSVALIWERRWKEGKSG